MTDARTVNPGQPVTYHGRMVVRVTGMDAVTLEERVRQIEADLRRESRIVEIDEETLVGIPCVPERP